MALVVESPCAQLHVSPCAQWGRGTRRANACRKQHNWHAHLAVREQREAAHAARPARRRRARPQRRRVAVRPVDACTRADGKPRLGACTTTASRLDQRQPSTTCIVAKQMRRRALPRSGGRRRRQPSRRRRPARGSRCHRARAASRHRRARKRIGTPWPSVARRRSLGARAASRAARSRPRARCGARARRRRRSSCRGFLTALGLRIRAPAHLR